MFQPVTDGSSTWRGRGETHEIDREHFMKIVFEGSVGSQVIPTGYLHSNENSLKLLLQKKLGGRKIY
jgi:hypothetical protein